MRKQLLALSIVMVLLMGVVAQAAGPMKAPRAIPQINFIGGNQAICSATIYGNNAYSKINATMTLWRGNTRLNAWSAQGIAQLHISKKVAVIKGHTYTLTVDYAIDGVKQPQKAITRTCP